VQVVQLVDGVPQLSDRAPPLPFDAAVPQHKIEPPLLLAPGLPLHRALHRARVSRYNHPKIAPRVRAMFEKHGVEYDVRSAPVSGANPARRSPPSRPGRTRASSGLCRRPTPAARGAKGPFCSPEPSGALGLAAQVRSYWECMRVTYSNLWAVGHHDHHHHRD
jgi:hypothetical protein